MSMNEAAAQSRGLTKQQKREAEAAIFGLQEQSRVPNFTNDEIERMRAIISQHDNGAGGVPKEFDLNNPPTVPYTHQEFPKMVYDHAARKVTVVQNEAQLHETLRSGFDLEPYSAEPVEAPRLDAATLTEVERIDAELKKKPAKK